jgi:bifunctional non-homologous end joining protein LigD
MTSAAEVKVGKRRLTVSNLDKVLFPAAAFTKAHLIDYYVRVAKFLLPHLRNRPITLKRFPDGVQGEPFWEKDAPGFTPPWVRTFPVPRKHEAGDIHYIVVDDLSTLAWCASIATIELHPFLHETDNLRRPTSVVFDLDPGEGADIFSCAEVGFLLQRAVAKDGLETFPKVSGSKGIQIHVPLNTEVSYDETKQFARTIAEELARAHPRLIVAEMAKVLRAGKVFIDWSQNIQTKTTVGVYSLRAKGARPFVSMPVTWEELRTALKKRDGSRLSFDPQSALERLEQRSDLYAPVLQVKQTLPSRLAVVSGTVAEPRSKRLRNPTLEQYEAKRNFNRTREPVASVPRRSQQGGKRRFVIQKHAASHLHFDLRLEISDTLKSWAVPKGMPLAPDERRSAFAVEDHPIDYLTFEGVIPEGEYGGGTVMVWDIGTYEVLDGSYWKGTLHVFLNGTKLKGEWLVQRQEDGAKSRWLITKVGKRISIPATKESRSVVSGRTIEEIAEARDAVWNSKQEETPSPAKERLPAARKHKSLGFIAPMLATKVKKLPHGPEWMYEWKWDGFRAIAVKQGDRVQLFSRKGRDQTASFPALARSIATIHAGTAILDGEIIAITSHGEVSFQELQNRGKKSADWHILFCAFDVLNLEGEDLREIPIEQRRQKLAEITSKSGVLFSAELHGDGKRLLSIGRKSQREGIVAKHRDSIYQSGVRSSSWQKLQLKPQQEFVVGGYRPKGKTGLELLLVGYYEHGKLMYAGKVRNELNQFNRKELFNLLTPLRTKKCPFANLPNSRRDHFGESVTAEEMKDYVWLNPEVVIQAKFSEWTKSGVLRHAEFVGVRADVEAIEVVRE